MASAFSRVFGIGLANAQSQADKKGSHKRLHRLTEQNLDVFPSLLISPRIDRSITPNTRALAGTHLTAILSHY